MLCAVIKGPSFEEAKEQILATFSHVALFEFRLDQFLIRDKEGILKLQALAEKPVIFTLRPTWMGGNYADSEKLRLQELQTLCALQPEYVDIESSVEKTFIENFQKVFPDIKLIVSFHDFSKTPEDLGLLYASLKATSADIYKIATHANCSSDALRLMLHLKNTKDSIIGISMGNYGLPSRLLATQFNSPWTYVAPALPAPHGQLTCDEMAEIYGCTTTKSTKLFGLIGKPIDQSISHYVHNAVMRQHQLESLYLKMEISPQKLETFLKQLQAFGWQGLSVTMPLKERILPFIECDHNAKEIGAANTLVFKQDRILGFNTDGIGAIRALKRTGSVQGKKIALIGCGGAAKAIAYEAIKEGCQVSVFGRNLNAIEHPTSVTYLPLDKLNCRKFDIIINCTPVEMPFDASLLKSDTIVMDIKTLPKKSELLQVAESKGCQIVFGYEMFLYQAFYQFLLWFPHLDPVRLESSLRSECEKVIDLLH